jgi:hypothetical protein
MVSEHKAPLHERIRPLGWLRDHLRGGVFGLLKKLADTDDARGILASSLRGLLRTKPALSLSHVDVAHSPYPDLGRPGTTTNDAGKAAPVFITARFRTGSTLLWNLFRHIDGCTAYYEPLNERRWFDPAARSDRRDPTHRNITDYWREYNGLEVLGTYFRDSWNDHHLVMDGHDSEPDLKRYVEILIERAPGRPVLQFNRIDFRLPWYRRNFPRAQLVHLYRHPRDQWCSALLDITRFPKSAGMTEFPPHDGFYLLNWARDLKHHFPFLDESRVSHPYQLFYYIWKLSYLYGKCNAHYSLSFEELVQNPETTLTNLFAALNVTGYNLAGLMDLMSPPDLGRWRQYADSDWFERHEAACEQELAAFLGETEPAVYGDSR